MYSSVISVSPVPSLELLPPFESVLVPPLEAEESVFVDPAEGDELAELLPLDVELFV
jgi:hypothetical protein